MIDFYFELSIKAVTRTGRGISSRVIFDLDDIIAENLDGLLNNDEFKTDLNNQFSNREVLDAWSWQGDFRITKGAAVIERCGRIVSDRTICFQPGLASMEEADNRIVNCTYVMPCKELAQTQSL